MFPICSEVHYHGTLKVSIGHFLSPCRGVVGRCSRLTEEP